MTEPTMAPAELDETASQPGWQERKGLLAVAGAAVVVLLGLGAWFLVFSGGSSGDDDGLVASARTPGASAPAATPSATPTEAVTTPAEFEGDLGNDPFDLLFEPVADDSAPADTSAPTGPAAPPTTGVGGVPTTVPQVPTVPTGTPITVRVKLVSVDVSGEPYAATLEVDGATVTVAEGETFGAGNTLTLYRISEDRGGVVTVYKGDDLEATAKDITVGDSKKF